MNPPPPPPNCRLFCETVILNDKAINLAREFAGIFFTDSSNLLASIAV